MSNNCNSALRQFHERWSKEEETFWLSEIIHSQKEFSESTFGFGMRTKGIIAHIEKELAEIKENPGDVEEWADVVILALDGAWRAGYEPREVAEAILLKQAKNKLRRWPDWRSLSEDEPIEHIRGD